MEYDLILGVLIPASIYALEIPLLFFKVYPYGLVKRYHGYANKTTKQPTPGTAAEGYPLLYPTTLSLYINAWLPSLPTKVALRSPTTVPWIEKFGWKAV